MRLVTLPGVFRPISDTWLLADALDGEALLRGARVLDLCSGSGALAVRAALGGAREVVGRRRLAPRGGHDPPQRARSTASRVRARRGDLFAAVAGRAVRRHRLQPAVRAGAERRSCPRAGPRARGTPAATAARCSTASAPAPPEHLRPGRRGAARRTRRCSATRRPPRLLCAARPRGRCGGQRARPARPADAGAPGRISRPRACSLPARSRRTFSSCADASGRAFVGDRPRGASQCEAWLDRSGAARSPSDW